MPTLSVWRSLSWPNRISLMRLLGVPPFVVLLLNQQDWPAARYWAIGLFVALGLSDALDGYLARRSGKITPLGSMLDPLADKALVTCAAILLATDWGKVPGIKLPNWVAVSIVGKDLWVLLGYVVLHLIMGKVKIRPTWAGKLCTAGQIVMVAFVLVAPDVNRLGGEIGTHIALLLGWLVVVLCILAVASYTRVGLSLLAQQHEEEQSAQ